MKNPWSKESHLYGEGRKLPGNPVCARCGKEQLPVSILVIGGGGQEVTYCLECIVEILPLKFTSVRLAPKNLPDLIREARLERADLETRKL